MEMKGIKAKTLGFFSFVEDISERGAIKGTGENVWNSIQKDKGSSGGSFPNYL